MCVVIHLLNLIESWKSNFSNWISNSIVGFLKYDVLFTFFRNGHFEKSRNSCQKHEKYPQKISILTSFSWKSSGSWEISKFMSKTWKISTNFLVFDKNFEISLIKILWIPLHEIKLGVMKKLMKHYFSRFNKWISTHTCDARDIINAC